MSTRKDVEPIFEKALQLVDEREHLYGDSWKTRGEGTCVPLLLRKASGIRAQWERGQYATEKFREDLLDLINWSAFAYWHLERGEK